MDLVIVRCVAGLLGAWEISTGDACGCVFQWRYLDGRGVLFIGEGHCGRCCQALAEYAAKQSFAVRLGVPPDADRVEHIRRLHELNADASERSEDA